MKLTMHEPASMTTDTWSRRVTSTEWVHWRHAALQPWIEKPATHNSAKRCLHKWILISVEHNRSSHVGGQPDVTWNRSIAHRSLNCHRPRNCHEIAMSHSSSWKSPYVVLMDVKVWQWRQMGTLLLPYVPLGRVVATVGGAAHPSRFPPGTNFFFFFLVPGTMFHNRGSIIAQYTYVIYIENDLVRLWIPAGAPPVIGAALCWLHSLRLPLLFTIINHHSDWAGYNPASRVRQYYNFPPTLIYKFVKLLTISFHNLTLQLHPAPMHLPCLGLRLDMWKSAVSCNGYSESFFL